MGLCANQKISGWGRFPVEECRVYRPEKGCEINVALETEREASIIARGLGRSYGDAAVNGGAGVLDLSRLNRMLSFEPETGLLECEAGVSLKEILDTFVPRGYFLPVLPGTKFVTVGGAIANDIHGKNHHKNGTFGQSVENLRLLTASGEVLTCSPADNAEAFWATVGGIGLTGVILSAKLRLNKIETAHVLVDYVRTINIEDTLDTLTSSDEDYTYSVAWVDCLARGRTLGRSVLMRGNHATRLQMPNLAVDPLHVKPKANKAIPVDFPSFVLNPLSIKAFNAMYYGMHKTVRDKLVDYDSYFCPLDAIAHWNRMYGKRGFGQYQVTFPNDQRDGLIALLERLSQSSRASFLAVLKRLGPGSPGLFSYPSEGYTITFDLPMRGDLVAFLRGMDKIVLDHGGRLYCAKDCCALPETFAVMYPRLDEFKLIKAKLDPNNRFSSSMARRLGIVP